MNPKELKERNEKLDIIQTALEMISKGFTALNKRIPEITDDPGKKELYELLEKHIVGISDKQDDMRGLINVLVQGLMDKGGI